MLPTETSIFIAVKEVKVLKYIINNTNVIKMLSHLGRLLACRALQTRTPFPTLRLHRCSPSTAKQLEDTETHS